jgi:hypothetical protein
MHGTMNLKCNRFSLSKKVRRNAGNRESKFLKKAGEFVSSRPAVRRAKGMELWCGVWFWSYGRQMSQKGEVIRS